jgi:hypothetical protein
MLNRHPLHIPIVGEGEVFLSMERFTFATALDSNIGHYHIKLNVDDQNL